LENLSFGLWLGVVLLIVGIGLTSMISAYWGQESVTVIFPEPLTRPADAPLPTLQPEAAEAFEQGCLAYQASQYRRAVDEFTKALQQDSTFAEAYHNRGRVIANLRRIPEGVADLVKASELYLQQGNSSELAQLKQDLALLQRQKSA
jgi:tetratricopeptide (TPR) repeat protein